MSRLLCGLAGLCAVWMTGCGASPGTLSGTVSYKKARLVMGTVKAYGENGEVAHGTIEPDGTYSIPHCPGGKVKLVVFSPHPQAVTEGRDPAMMAVGRRGNPGAAVIAPQPAAVDASRWFEIPGKYSDPDASGLEVEVSGNTVYNIEME